MTEWPKTTIGAACQVYSGGTPSKQNADYWRGPIPWVSAKDLKADRIFDAELQISQRACAESAAKIAPVGTLLILVRGMGLANGIQIGEVTSPVAFNQDIRAIVPPPTVNSRFLLLALRHQLADGGKGVISSAAHGTLKIDADALRHIEFPIPPLPEQHRIVAILDEAFRRIAIAKTNIERNIRNARQVFDGQLNKLFSDTENTISLATLASDITDGDHMPPPKASTGVPFITISNIDKRGRTVKFGTTFLVPREYFHALKPNRRPRRGDVLYTVTGATLGIPVLVNHDVEFCFQRHIALIRPGPGISSAWLCYAMASDNVFAQATTRATGAAQKTVSLAVLRSIRMPSHSQKEQADIVAQLDALSQLTYRLEDLYAARFSALDELLQAVLSSAFEGQLTAKKADDMMAVA